MPLTPQRHRPRSGPVVRLADPASPRLREQVADLAGAARYQLAEAVLDEAVSVAADPAADLAGACGVPGHTACAAISRAGTGWAWSSAN